MSPTLISPVSVTNEIEINEGLINNLFFRKVRRRRDRACLSERSCIFFRQSEAAHVDAYRQDTWRSKVHFDVVLIIAIISKEKMSGQDGIISLSSHLLESTSSSLLLLSWVSSLFVILYQHRPYKLIIQQHSYSSHCYHLLMRYIHPTRSSHICTKTTNLIKKR